MSTTYEVLNSNEPPPCQCCGGSGTHEFRRYASRSPYDADIECTTCNGKGASWFSARPNTCTGYYTLMRRHS